MYPLPEQAEETQNQAKLIVNIVVVAFLVIGLVLVLQHFHFIFVGDIPLVGDWFLEMYERIFGPPHILILHGDDSIGDWLTLRNTLAEELIFISEEIDVQQAGSQLSILLPRYSLVVVEDCRTMDKAMLINLDDYVKGGGNLIWVADAGTRGDVMHDGKVLAKQGGWDRDLVCINQRTLTTCNCSTVSQDSDCKFLADEAEQKKVTFSNRIGAGFRENVLTKQLAMHIVDRSHWSVVGLLENFPLPGVDRFTEVSAKYKAGLLSNLITEDGSTYPGIITQDQFGAEGMVVYFAYPPEHTMEILKPLVERLRY